MTQIIAVPANNTILTKESMTAKIAALVKREFPQLLARHGLTEVQDAPREGLFREMNKRAIIARVDTYVVNGWTNAEKAVVMDKSITTLAFKARRKRLVCVTTATSDRVYIHRAYCTYEYGRIRGAAEGEVSHRLYMEFGEHGLLFRRAIGLAFDQLIVQRALGGD